VATKRVKFIKPWQMTPAGAEMELDAPVADLLIKRGRAEEVKEPTAPLSKKALKKLKRNNANR
jgi:hypothetical protein